MQATGSIIDLRDQRNCHAIVQCGFNFLRVNQPKFISMSQRGIDALRDVEIRGEIAALGKNHIARTVVVRRKRQRACEQLEDVDRRRVRGNNFGFLRAEQSGDSRADLFRQVNPISLVPGPYQALAPFVLNSLPQAGGRGLGQRAQRITVEINHALGHRKTFARKSKAVGAIQRFAIDTRCHVRSCVRGIHRGSRRMARTGEASSVASFREKAVSS